MKRLLVLAVVAAAVSAIAPTPASAEPCELTCVIHRCYAFDGPIGTICT